jgi:hypothetical protein
VVDYVKERGMVLDDIFGLNVKVLDRSGVMVVGLFVASLVALLTVNWDANDAQGQSSKVSYGSVDFLTFTCVAYYAVSLLVLSSKRKAILTRSFPGASSQCIKDAGEEMASVVQFDIGHLAGLLAVLGASSPSGYRMQGFVTLLSGAVRAAVLLVLMADVKLDRMIYMFEIAASIHFMFAGVMLLFASSGASRMTVPVAPGTRKPHSE